MAKKSLFRSTGSIYGTFFLAVAFSFFAALGTLQAADVKTIRFATLQSPTNPMIIELQKALDEIVKQTKGSVKFQMHYGTEAGFKAKEFVNALDRNLLDMSLIATSASALEYPWLAVSGIPFLSPNLQAREKMLEAIIPMFQEFSDEHGIVPLAYPLHVDTYLVIYCNEELNTLPNIKGKLIRVYDPNTIALIKGLGATPVSLQKSEIYLGLQKGTIDGAITGTTSAKDLHFNEVSKYMVRLTPLFNPNIVGVSKIAWKKMSKDQQKTFRDVLAKWDKEYMELINSVVAEKKSFEYAIQHGMKVLEPAADMKAMFPKIKEGITKDFLKKSGAKGKRALDLINGALKKAGY